MQKSALGPLYQGLKGSRREKQATSGKVIRPSRLVLYEGLEGFQKADLLV